MEATIIIQKLEMFYRLYGYVLIFVGSFVEISPFGWIVPGGTLLSLGGFFSYGENLSLGLTIFSGWAGAWIALIASYSFGRHTGDYLIKKLNQEKIADKAKLLLQRHGGTILTTSMLSNLTRFWVAYVAGSQRYPLINFLFYSGVASLAWSSLFIVAGYLVGSGRTKLETTLAKLGVLSWVLFVIAAFVLYLTIKKEFLHSRGREKQGR